MNDAMDGAMDGVNDEEEADKVYSQICGEIGIEFNETGNVANKPIENPASNQVNIKSIRKLFD